jgi:hypothetical protein
MNTTFLRNAISRAVALAIALLPAATRAQITQDGTASWPRTTAPGTYDASASDKLVVVVSGEHHFSGNLTGNCTGVTYNDVPLVLAVAQAPAAPATGGHGQTHSSIWYLDNPGLFSGSGTIAVTFTGNSWVATAIGLSGTKVGAGATTAVSGSASADIATTDYGAMVIAAVGMGGQGNTANPLPGVTATAPDAVETIAALKIGSDWAGHAVARAIIDIPATRTFTFNTGHADLVTVAAAFEAADPAAPNGPTPDVHDIIPGESVELFWTNLLPVTGSDVWVDVWIGNDPATLVREIEADPDGLNLTTLEVAAAPGTYYGRIDSYLGGSPSGTPATGDIFSFEISATGLLAETWLGLRPLPTLLVLQHEGIAVRAPDTAGRITAAGIENLASPGGARLRGLFTPQHDGPHTFHIAGSHNAALWLSTDQSRFNKERVAWHLGFTGPEQWAKYPTQATAPVELLAGVPYYIEAQVMNPSGLGHLTLGWTPPGASNPAPVPASRLTYLPVDLDDLDDNNLPDQWEIDTGLAASGLPGAGSEYGDPDRDGISNFDEYRYDLDPLDIDERPNGLTRETWTSPGIGGSSLNTLIHNLRIHDFPNEILHVPGIDDHLRGSQYGARYRGFLIAPHTGTYRFWVTGTCQVQLWLADGSLTPHGESSPRTDRFGKRLIAWNEQSPTGLVWPVRHNFDRTPGQRSQAIHLVEGGKYYIEVLHKRGTVSGHDHVSIAWQPPGQAREIIPATAFLADIPHADDSDDDGLPDSWQDRPDVGLDDPALTAVQRGQFGDPDQDGLINLYEYQYGTDPLHWDTDDDGLSDYDEIFHYGTDPLVPNTLAPQSVPNFPSPQQYDLAATTGGWTHNSDGSLSAWDPRGAITYTFQVGTENPGPGIHEIIITGSAIGDIRPVERLPLVLSLNGGSPFASLELVSENGGPATVKALTPWLAPGTHTLTILHDNHRALRRLRIHSIEAVRLGGISANPGHPDWTIAQTEAANRLTRVPAASRTSPVCIEGLASSLAAVNLAFTPHGATVPTPLEPAASINNGFFANVPLSPDGPTTLDASFIDGLLTESEPITWTATNLFDFDQNELHLRANDSLLLDAWSTPNPDGGGFTVTLDGVPLKDENQNTTHTSGQPFAVEFAAPATRTTVAFDTNKTDLVTVAAAFAAPASGQIVRNGQTSWTRDTAPGTYDASTSDKLVVVVTGEHHFSGNLTGNCTGVTYNGEPLVQAVAQAPAAPATGGHGQTHCSIWYLDNPGLFSGSGTIAVTFTGNNWVATAIGLSGTLPGSGPTAAVSGASSAEVATTAHGSMIIAAVGMGGQGNTASPLPGVTATSPPQANTLAALKIGSNWAGHAVSSATIAPHGTRTLVASHDGQTATITLHVHTADFGPAHSVAALSPRPWTPPVLGPLHLVEHDDLLNLAETTTDPETNPRTFVAAVHQAGMRRVLARIPDDEDIHGAPAAIIATGTVHGFRVANVDQTADPQIVFRYQDGTWLMSSTIIAVDLPPDILIRLTTVHQGTVFMNGSNILELRASDFDANGVATIYYEWAGSGDPHLCHNVKLFVDP